MIHPHYLLPAGQIFTIIFIMLGPLRLPESFATATAGLNHHDKNQLSLKAGLLSFFALIAAGFIGSRVLKSWEISPATLTLAAGILFLISALPPLINRTKEVTPEKLDLGPASISTRLLISPHGLAVVIVLFTMAHDKTRIFTITGCLAAIEVMNVLYMSFIKPSGEKPSMVKMMLKTTLGTLQFALSLQIIYTSIQWLKA
jgi:multiple antibiotic resistance protein